MSKIIVEHNPAKERLEDLGVYGWAIWSKEESTFPWQYSSEETCYLLEGEVKVTPDGGEPVEFGKGALVIFPEGISCTWEISKAVRKHYRFA